MLAAHNAFQAVVVPGIQSNNAWASAHGLALFAYLSSSCPSSLAPCSTATFCRIKALIVSPIAAEGSSSGVGLYPEGSDLRQLSNADIDDNGDISDGTWPVHLPHEPVATCARKVMSNDWQQEV